MDIFSRRILRTVPVILAVPFMTVNACAQDEPAEPFTYTNAIERIRASGYEGPIKEHPAIIAHVKQEAGPKLESLINELKEAIKVEVEFEYGAGDQTVVFKPYKAKNFVLHSMGVGPDFSVMDGFLTMGETLDLLEIPDLRNAIVKIAVPRDNNGNRPELTVRISHTDAAVKILVSQDIYTSETYLIDGLSFHELISIELGDRILNPKLLYSF